MQIRVFNYNTLERVFQFEAHSDYVRSIAVHPTQPYILTSSGKSMVFSSKPYLQWIISTMVKPQICNQYWYLQSLI